MPQAWSSGVRYRTRPLAGLEDPALHSIEHTCVKLICGARVYRRVVAQTERADQRWGLEFAHARQPTVVVVCGWQRTMMLQVGAVVGSSGPGTACMKSIRYSLLRLSRGTDGPRIGRKSVPALLCARCSALSRVSQSVWYQRKPPNQTSPPVERMREFSHSRAVRASRDAHVRACRRKTASSVRTRARTRNFWLRHVAVDAYQSRGHAGTGRRGARLQHERRS